jgi:hypothetical protein
MRLLHAESGPLGVGELFGAAELHNFRLKKSWAGKALMWLGGDFLQNFNLHLVATVSQATVPTSAGNR